MVKVKHFFLMLLSICSMTSYAYDFEVDGLYYNLISASDKTCELAGFKEGITSAVIPKSVTTRGMELSVTRLSTNSLFENCSTISTLELQLPIDVPSFSGCKNLKEVKLVNGVKTIGDNVFKDCPIDSLYVPNSVTRIGVSAINLVKVLHLEDGEAVLNCGGKADSMEKLYLGRNLNTGTPAYYYKYDDKYRYYEVFHNTSICGASLKSVKIGPNVTKIAISTFDECTKLTNITIPRNVTIVEMNAFRGCTQMANLTVEDGDTSLKFELSYTTKEFSVQKGVNIGLTIPLKGYGPFVNSPLKNVYIGRNIDYIINKSNSPSYNIGTSYGGSYRYDAIDPSFFNQTTLTEVNYGTGIESLFPYMFCGQTNSSALHIPNTINTIGDYCFSKSAITNLQVVGTNVSVGNYAFNQCEKLGNVTLNGVSSLGNSCFSGCSSLKSLDFGTSAPSFGSNVFKDCSSLQIVDLGSIESVPSGFLSGCTSLTWLSMGANLRYIESGAFNGCNNLITIGLKSFTPPSFANSNELSAINKFNSTLYIPEGTIAAYEQAALWKDFLFKEERDIPEHITTLPEGSGNTPPADDPKNIVINGAFTGGAINQINASTIIETLDLQAAIMTLDNQNAYYKTGKRQQGGFDDIDVVRGAPYYSYEYYTAPTTTSGTQNEYNSSGKIINIITTCFSAELTNAFLNGNLKSIILPTSLGKLGENAIKGTQLTDLYIYATTPPAATSASFGSTNKTKCVLHVSKGCKNIYSQAVGWKDFKNIVEDSDVVEVPTENYIAVQPTDDNPQVQLAIDDAAAQYQWFKYSEQNGDTIDITNALFGDYGWVNTGNGWQSNMHKAESSATIGFECSFNVNDELSFDWTVSSEHVFDQLQCYIGDELLFVKSGESNGSFQKTFENPISGRLNFVYIKDGTNDFAQDKVIINNVKITNSDHMAMQIPETLENGSKRILPFDAVAEGDKVFCIVALSDGKLLKSDVFVIGPVNYIKTQPTLDNLSVELGIPVEGASYQWFAEYGEDETIVPISVSQDAEWVENNGVWTPADLSVKGTFEMRADVKLKARDILRFDWINTSKNFWCYRESLDGRTTVSMLGKSDTGSGTYKQEFTQDHEFTLVFKLDNSYQQNANARVSVSNIRIEKHKEIEGATNEILDESQFLDGDMVYCVVTLPNGRVLTSDKVQTIANYISKQPSVDDLSVELYIPSANAKYQWFRATTPFTRVEGANAAQFPKVLMGDVDGQTIYCSVTLPNGRRLRSDNVELPYTGIDNILVESQENNAIFNLNGIRMATTSNIPKGVYVVNGKKMIVK